MDNREIIRAMQSAMRSYRWKILRGFIKTARELTKGLEGQALDSKTLRELKRRTIRDLMAAKRAEFNRFHSNLRDIYVSRETLEDIKGWDK